MRDIICNLCNCAALVDGVQRAYTVESLFLVESKFIEMVQDYWMICCVTYNSRLPHTGAEVLTVT